MLRPRKKILRAAYQKTRLPAVFVRLEHMYGQYILSENTPAISV